MLIIKLEKGLDPATIQQLARCAGLVINQNGTVVKDRMGLAPRRPTEEELDQAVRIFPPGPTQTHETVDVVKRLVDSQAELQTGLGMYRMRDIDVGPDEATIEGYLSRSLKMQQRILALLGLPMAGGPDEDVAPRA